MPKNVNRLARRRFLKTALSAGAAVMAPQIIPSSALGLDGAVPPSERIVIGGIGIGNRGIYDLSCFLEQPDVQFKAVCDIKAARRDAVKKFVDERYKNNDCVTYRDFRELLARDDIDGVLIATGPNWHATAAIYAAKAGKDMYCEKPCSKTIDESLVLADTMRRTGRIFQAGTQRRSLPNFAFACELAKSGRLGKLKRVHAHPAPWGLDVKMSGWLPAEQEPPMETLDWNMYLGPAAWRPFNKQHMVGGNFEKGGGLIGGGVLEWGTHCVDLCQWAANADQTTPVEFNPAKDSQIVARYADGVELVIREHGWLPLGSCPVRFEGEDGWVETGDSGKLELSSPDLLAGAPVEMVEGYPATFHVRDFLDCMRSRSQPIANAEVACNSHIACHGANMAMMLGRKLTYDPKKNVFLGDDQANRLRSEALREPWHS
jgi:predicted dehydrogenase